MLSPSSVIQKPVRLFHRQSEITRMTHFLPVDIQHLSRLKRVIWPNHVLPLTPLGLARLSSARMRQHGFITLHRASVESLIWEPQLRRQAMPAAEKNIQDRLKALVFEAQNPRQNTIDAIVTDRAERLATGLVAAHPAGTSARYGSRHCHAAAVPRCA